MKYLIYTLLLLAPLQTFAQLQQVWLSVESRHTSAGIFADASVFLEFTADSLRKTTVFDNTTYALPYSVKGDSLFVGDSTTILIKHLSADSLILSTNPYSETLYYPVKPLLGPIKLSKLDLLGSVWSMYIDEVLYHEKLIFQDTNYYIDKLGDSKLAVQWVDDHTATTEPLKWSLMTYEGHTFLTVSPDYIEVITNQVVSVGDDEILLSPMRKDRKVKARLVKNKPSIPEKNYFINDLLVAKKWKRVKSATLVEYDLGWTCQDTILIAKNDFKEKDIFFKFKPDNTYCLYLDHEVYHCGSWQLLGDGSTIQMDQGFSDLNYFTIEKINRDQLVLSFCSRFSYRYAGSKCTVNCYKIYLE